MLVFRSRRFDTEYATDKLSAILHRIGFCLNSLARMGRELQ
jgi:hypothetical protein